VIVSHTLRIYGKGESDMVNMLRDKIEKMTNPTVAPYAKSDECMLRVTAKAATAEEAEAMLKPAVAEVMDVVGEWVYGIDVDDLESVCVALLKQRGKTLAAAESCTGGLIAKRVTDVPGASAVFLGGVVSYTNGVKNKVLNVSESKLVEFGAVSEPVAIAMAEGVRALTGADYALSVTGVAGPDSDERGNPVGLVYIGLASPEGTECRRCEFGKRTRDHIRMQAVNTALDMLRRKLQ
ncbi:MAG: nicotinamide-nucleotide amidohydrolase family protein, partial [Oscillospiraceae bacterium]|nr:nicotinamide-nucleotide amidohydrolase family protein [Oscillospiraceae bacterium]